MTSKCHNIHCVLASSLHQSMKGVRMFSVYMMHGGYSFRSGTGTQCLLQVLQDSQTNRQQAAEDGGEGLHVVEWRLLNT